VVAPVTVETKGLDGKWPEAGDRERLERSGIRLRPFLRQVWPATVIPGLGWACTITAEGKVWTRRLTVTGPVPGER